MKTFEQLWESCEDQIVDQLSAIKVSDSFDDLVYIIESIERSITNNSQDEIAMSLGYLLYRLSFISKKFNINIYEELRKVMEDEKTNLLEVQLGGNVDELKE